MSFVIAYYSGFSKTYGDFCYSIRWFLVFVPSFLFYLPEFFQSNFKYKKVAVLSIHGMGETDSSYSVPLVEDLRNLVGSSEWERDIHFESIY